MASQGQVAPLLDTAGLPTFLVSSVKYILVSYTLLSEKEKNKKIEETENNKKIPEKADATKTTKKEENEEFKNSVDFSCHTQRRVHGTLKNTLDLDFGDLVAHYANVDYVTMYDKHVAKIVGATIVGNLRHEFAPQEHTRTTLTWQPRHLGTSSMNTHSTRRPRR